MFCEHLRPVQASRPLAAPLRHGARSRGARSGRTRRVAAVSGMQPPRRAVARLLPHDVPLQEAVLLPVRGGLEDVQLPAVGRTPAARRCRGAGQQADASRGCCSCCPRLSRYGATRGGAVEGKPRLPTHGVADPARPRALRELPLQAGQVPLGEWAGFDFRRRRVTLMTLDGRDVSAARCWLVSAAPATVCRQVFRIVVL
jgi:hypothetical protein